MNRVKNAVVSVKNHTKNHKATYAAGAVAIAAIALQQSNLRSFYKFLEERGINPQEFYYPEGLELEN